MLPPANVVLETSVLLLEVVLVGMTASAVEETSEVAAEGVCVCVMVVVVVGMVAAAWRWLQWIW